MSTLNTGFRGEIKKNVIWILLLSSALIYQYLFQDQGFVLSEFLSGILDLPCYLPPAVIYAELFPLFYSVAESLVSIGLLHLL